MVLIHVSLSAHGAETTLRLVIACVFACLLVSSLACPFAICSAGNKLGTRLSVASGNHWANSNPYNCVQPFQVSGILFLGQDLEDFSTPEHAFRSSLLAVLGNWDWQVLEEIGHVKAAFWLWVFSIVLSLISLNMLLVA